MEAGTVEVPPSARCRLCAAHEAIKVDIFGDEGRSRKLGEKIQTCLPIKVGTEDRLPKSLCYRCMYLLEKFYDFRQCCLDANDMLEVCVEEYEARAAAAANNANNTGRFESLEQQLSNMKMEVQNDVMPTLQVQIAQSPSSSRSNSEHGGSDPPHSPPASPPAPSTNPEPSASTVASTSQDVVIELDAPTASQRTPQAVPRKHVTPAPPAVKHRDKVTVTLSTLASPQASSTPASRASGDPDDEDVVDLTDDPPSPSDHRRSRPVGRRVASSLLKETLTRNNNNELQQLQRSRKRSSSVEIEAVVTSLPATSRRVSVASVANALMFRNVGDVNGDEEGSSSSRRKNAKPRKIARADDTHGPVDLDKPFSCMLCNKAFTLKNALSRHFNACHGVEINDLQQQQRPVKGAAVMAATDYDQDIECIEVEEEDETSRDALLLYCEICMRSFNDKSSLWLHLMYSHKDAAPFACGLCLKLFKDNASLAKHWKGHYTENNFRNEYFNMERRYSCEICGRQDNSRKKLTNHMKVHVFDASFDPEMLIIVNADYYNSEKRQFEFCDLDASSQDASSSFTSSMYVGNDGESYLGGSSTAYLPCERCYKAFESEEALAKHRKTAHRAYVDCQVCGETFDTEEKLMAHVTAEHFDGNHMLAEQSPSMYNPFEPVVDFANSDAFYCKYCSQQFATMRDVERHQRGCKSSAAAKAAKADACSHHCELCKKSFVSEDCLVKHKKGAHKLDASLNDADVTYNSFYFCEFCGSSHETKVARWRHVNDAHSNEAAIRCGEKACGKIFASESLCVEHRSHHNVQGAYPNTCELCGKLWHSRVEYWKHIQGVHAEMLPFICGICLKMFCDTASLVSHVRLTHKLQKGSYHCAVCARQYSNQSKCARHEAIHGDAGAGDAAATTAAPLAKPRPVVDRPAAPGAVILKTPSVALTAAVKKAPAPAPVAAKPPGLSKSVNLLWCDLCPQIANFPSVYALANHRRSAHSLHPCDLCTKFYGRNSHLWKHVNKKHRGNPEIMCNICLKVSATKTQLTVHFKKIHKMDFAVDTPQPTAQEVESAEANSHILTIPSFQAPLAAGKTAPIPKQYTTYDCHVCHKSFIKRYMLRKHLSFCVKRARRTAKSEPHSATGVYPCDVCRVQFDSRSRLSDHARSHHKPANTNACAACEESFPTRPSLYAHIQASHPELRCPTCDKFVRTAEDLDEHAAHHDTHDHPPHCELCGEVVSNRVRIWHHFNSYHKEDIPYLCGVCFSRLPDTPALVAHVKEAHPGAAEAEKTCRVCAKSYSSVYKVLEHVAKYHAGCVGCKECLAVFPTHTQLRQHAADQHGAAGDEAATTPEKPTTTPAKSSVKAVAAEGKSAVKTVSAATVQEVAPRQRTKRSYSCDKCPLTFIKPSELNAHRRRLHLSAIPLVSIPGGDVNIKDELMDDDNDEEEEDEEEENGEDGREEREGAKRASAVACRVCSEPFDTAEELKEHHLEGCASLHKRRRLALQKGEGEGMPVLKPNKPVGSPRGGGKSKDLPPDLEAMPTLSSPGGGEGDDDCDEVSDGVTQTPDDSVDGEVDSKASDAGTDWSNEGTAHAQASKLAERPAVAVASLETASETDERSATPSSVEETTNATTESDSVANEDEGGVKSVASSAAVSTTTPSPPDDGEATTDGVADGETTAVSDAGAEDADCLDSLEDALNVLEAQNS